MHPQRVFVSDGAAVEWRAALSVAAIRTTNGKHGITSGPLSSLISGDSRELKIQTEISAHNSPSRCAVPTTLVDRRWSPSVCHGVHGYRLQITGASIRTGRFPVISQLRHLHTRWNGGIPFAMFCAVSQVLL